MLMLAAMCFCSRSCGVRTSTTSGVSLSRRSLASDALGQKVKLRISMNALRSVDRSGGLDPFLLKAKNDALSDRALKLKRLIAKKQSAPATTTAA